MKAIVLPDYNTNVIRAMKSLELRKLPVPEVKGEDVLIRVAAAPCNPSDIAFMRGGYNIRKPVPVVMGFECTGTVVETGSDEMAARLKGKRVSCFSQGMENGTWAEYFITNYRNCLIIRDNINDDQAAALCINPFTAYALFTIAMGKKAAAIIQNGASGQIGTLIRKMARRDHLPVINLVRKEEHIRDLANEGERLVINVNDPAFEAALKEIAGKYQATVAFDAVGGDLSGMILNAMPPGSELIIYGGLSGKFSGMFNPLEIIFKSKTVRGFNLGDWKTEVGDEHFRQVSEELQEMILNEFIFTRIQSIYRLDEIQAALERYIRNMSAGKILFKP
jgi:NADPH:quinone reductase-like Zn-dependent oxidoreductase